MKHFFLSILESSIEYTFNNIEFLYEALRHSSFVNEQTYKTKDNERLEFLGDTILNFTVSDILIKIYPNFNEGTLSKIRSTIVSESQLSNVAKSINLGNYLFLGKGEIQTNGRKKKSILADTLEAIIAAVYIDGGINSSKILIKKLFNNFVKTPNISNKIIDYKSKLQEKSQEIYQVIPYYTIINETGPDHKKVFKVLMTIENIKSYGKGFNRKNAEQLAARKGLQILMKKDNI